MKYLLFQQIDFLHQLSAGWDVNGNATEAVIMTYASRDGHILGGFQYTSNDQLYSSIETLRNKFYETEPSLTLLVVYISHYFEEIKKSLI